MSSRDIVDVSSPSVQCDEYIAKCIPFRIRSGLEKESCNTWKDLLLRRLQEQEAMLDISTADQGQDFKGNPADRNIVELRPRDFVQAYLARHRHESHWINEVEDMSLYLSQCTLYCKSVSHIQIDFPESLGLLKQLHMSNCDVETINLWMNLHSAASTLHYDANHNYLVVLEGCKEVRLFSPICTAELSPYSAFVEAPNHSHLSVEETELLLQRIVSSQSGGAFEVRVEPGDILFIPEGWWHQVTSAELTMAVNIWFPSELGKLVHRNSHMIPYVARTAAHALAFPQSEQHETGTGQSCPHKHNDKLQYTMEDLSCMINEVLTNSTCTSGFLRDIVNSPFESIRDVWIPFFAQDKSKLTHLCRQFPPELANAFLRNWDHNESLFGDEAKTVYRALLEGCPDLEETMKFIMQQSDQWTNSTQWNRFQAILGVR